MAFKKTFSRDIKKREKLEKEAHDLRMSLDARNMELRNRAADVQAAESTMRDYQQQIKGLQVVKQTI